MFPNNLNAASLAIQINHEPYINCWLSLTGILLVMSIVEKNFLPKIWFNAMFLMSPQGNLLMT